MKPIDLSVLPPEFVQRDCLIAGKECVLIFPSELSLEWTPDLLNFRSVIIEKSTGIVVSAGFKKFLNLGEKPHLYPNPDDYTDWNVENKMDGSLIIISKFNNELIIRTRATTNAYIHDTGNELHRLISSNHGITDNSYIYSEKFSLLFEHVTPSRPIVIRYEKPELILIGVIRHSDYFNLLAPELDALAAQIGVRRPEVYSFNSLDEIIETCKTLKGREGFVLSYNNNQNRVKIKGLEYLKLHRFKSHATLPHTLDLFFEYGMPGEEDFRNKLITSFDYECYEQVKEFIEPIYAAQRIAGKLLFSLNLQIEPLKLLKRSEAAKIIQASGDSETVSLSFHLLSGKPLSHKIWRGMMEKELKSLLTDKVNPDLNIEQIR